MPIFAFCGFFFSSPDKPEAGRAGHEMPMQLCVSPSPSFPPLAPPAARGGVMVNSLFMGKRGGENAIPRPRGREGYFAEVLFIIIFPAFSTTILPVSKPISCPADHQMPPNCQPLALARTYSSSGIQTVICLSPSFFFFSLALACLSAFLVLRVASVDSALFVTVFSPFLLFVTLFVTLFVGLSNTHRARARAFTSPLRGVGGDGPSAKKKTALLGGPFFPHRPVFCFS